MLNLRLKTKVAAVIALFAVYFPIALYLRHSYVPVRAPPGTVATLQRPFFRFRPTGFDFLIRAPELNALADSNDAPHGSPFVIFENDRMLGPAHVSSDDISENGKGRFAHWRNIGFIVSSSDGTNPASNGRAYHVVYRLRWNDPAQAKSPSDLFSAYYFTAASAITPAPDLIFRVREGQLAGGPVFGPAIPSR